MTSAPIALRSNPGRYTFLGSPTLINAYAEQQGQDDKEPYAVLPCPGMVQFSAVTDTPCRGLIYLDDLDLIYTVHSSSVYKVNSAGTATYVGVLPGYDQVQMSRNMADPVQISIHTESGEFYVASDAVNRVTDTGLPTAISQDYGGGYTTYGISDGRFFISSINECQTIDATDYATAEQSADKLVRVKFDRGDLFLFGNKTIEPWRNTGNASFPFEPVSGACLQKGLVAPLGVVSADNSLMWAGEDNIVYRMNGYQPARISTHGVERSLEADTDRSNVMSLTYAFQGHTIANWTGTGWSHSYDAATQSWHDRQSYGISVWRARHSVRAWGKTLVGDTLTGNLYYLDQGAYDEDGNPLIWGMDTPTIHVFPNGAIMDALFIDIGTGVGTTTATSQGFTPKLMLSWSIDGGITFIGDRELPLGRRGDRVRVVTRRLGRFGPLGVVFRIRVSDPVIRAISGIDLAVRPLKK